MLMECDADVKINDAFIALAYFRANLSVSFCSSVGYVTKMSYLVPTKKAWAFCCNEVVVTRMGWNVMRGVTIKCSSLGEKKATIVPSG